MSLTRKSEDVKKRMKDVDRKKRWNQRMKKINTLPVCFFKIIFLNNTTIFVIIMPFTCSSFRFFDTSLLRNINMYYFAEEVLCKYERIV